jgi:multicomponent Na+:H+ antiporter subunit G
MMQLVWDVLIWIFLATGAGFGALAFLGLLIFPDIRSRMFTATRAVLISVSAITVAGILFGINGFLATGGSQYAMFVIHTLFFYGVVVIANSAIARIILDRTSPESHCQTNSGTGSETEPQKEN